MTPSIASTRQWIVAVDGGGSKIDVAAQLFSSSDPIPDSLERAECWNFPGTGSAHPGTWSSAQVHLEHAVRTVCGQLANSQQPLRAIVFALAGAGRAADKDRVLAWASALPELRDCRSIACVGDIETIVDFRKHEPQAVPTLAVILGTGSIVAARNAEGEIVRAGGWGPNLGDECSGGAIGNAALRKVTEWFDQAQPLEQASRFVFDIVAALTRANSLPFDASATVDRDRLASLLIATAADRTAAAALAPLVISLALESAVSDGLEVLAPQLECLARQIETVRRRSEFPLPVAPPPESIPQELELVFGGGLALHSPHLQRAVAQACTAKNKWQVRLSTAEPLLAALRFAVNLARSSR